MGPQEQRSERSSPVCLQCLTYRKGELDEMNIVILCPVAILESRELSRAS